MNKIIFWIAFVAIIIGGFVIMDSLKYSPEPVEEYNYEAIVLPAPAVNQGQKTTETTEETEVIEGNDEDSLNQQMVDMTTDESGIDEEIDNLEDLDF